MHYSTQIYIITVFKSSKVMEFRSLRVVDWLQGIDGGLSERSALFRSVPNWKIPDDCFTTAWQLSGDFLIIAHYDRCVLWDPTNIDISLPIQNCSWNYGD